MRTQELIARFLPPPSARVLDVGGATGIHAEWLAGHGYEVDLIDPVQFAGDVVGFTTAYFHMPAQLLQGVRDAALDAS